MAVSRSARALAVGAVVTGALAAGALEACSRGDARAASVQTSVRAGVATPRVTVARDVAPVGITATVPAYAVQPVSDGGRVTGTVTLDGPAPQDSTVVPAPDDQPACGRTHAVRTVDVVGGGVRGAVVWLIGMRAGKPLPSDRRHELELGGCDFTPRVLAAVAGGTVNLHGVDAFDTRLRFARAANGATDDGTVLLEAALSDAGQVVPSERLLAAPGAVEVRAVAQPWVRGWLLAFDHPYFATTGAGGAFSLDSVPPGSYQLVVWHERLGRTVRPVTVTAGQATTVAVPLGR